MADQLLTAAHVLQEIGARVNKTGGNAIYLVNHIRCVRQMQANFRPAPVSARLAWLQKLLNLIETLHQEYQQYLASQNQKQVEQWNSRYVSLPHLRLTQFQRRHIFP